MAVHNCRLRSYWTVRRQMGWVGDNWISFPYLFLPRLQCEQGNGTNIPVILNDLVKFNEKMLTLSLLFKSRKIQEEIEKGVLKGCRLNHFNTRPVGPHPIGSYETCCNATALSRGVSWFMQNRGNLTVLLHPLTRYEVVDHTARAMFLGPSLFLDLHVLSNDLGEPDKCLPIPYEDGAK